MEALNKKDVVKAVEKHGKILCIDGKFEKPKKVVNNLYAAEKMIIKPGDAIKHDLNRYDVVIIGCPGSEIPTAAYNRIRDYVVTNGGWVLSTDWAIRSIIENVFPGYIRWNEQRTGDVVVPCQIIDPNHPFLDGLVGELAQSKWQKQTKSGSKKDEFRWWLENRSFPIQVLNHQDVRVLIASWEIKNRWGEAPVLVEFNYGNTGGKVIHMISHTHLQKGGAKGKFASALILTNIIDEKISFRHGIKKGPAPGYVDPAAPQGQQPQYGQAPLEDQWVQPPSQQSQFVTPTVSGPGLTSTAQISEVNPNDGSFSYGTKCEYCGYDFGEIVGIIYRCNECGAVYHENCMNLQVNEGVCKKCNRILLW
jgi:hypothetical protein